ncbi:MAG: hypothetical protein LBL61_01975 [Elusimicrobiota bacterium]|jgi:hypothetical protein|nr:hypothetical protein [Elusimicrobiota bacterium]
MKRLLVILPALAALFCACAAPRFEISSLNPVSDISAPAPQSSYEMYSWHNGLDWGYSLFETATKVSSFAEITQRDDIVIGTDYFIDRLLELPRGAKVYWNLKRIRGFSLPDQKTVEKVLSAARRAGIAVEVIAWPA